MRLSRSSAYKGYYLDKMLWDKVVPLFTDDASVEIG